MESRMKPAACWGTCCLVCWRRAARARYMPLMSSRDGMPRSIAGELIRRGVSEAEGALFRSLVVAETMVSTLDRQGIEKEMGEAWIARFLKFSKRSALIKTTARTGAVPMAASGGRIDDARWHPPRGPVPGMG